MNEPKCSDGCLYGWESDECTTCILNPKRKDEMDEELKPCPFCGGKAEIRTTYEVLKTTTRSLFSYVRCERCFAQTWEYSYKNTEHTKAIPIESAIKAWNMRAGKVR